MEVGGLGLVPRINWRVLHDDRVSTNRTDVGFCIMVGSQRHAANGRRGRKVFGLMLHSWLFDQAYGASGLWSSGGDLIHGLLVFQRRWRRASAAFPHRQVEGLDRQLRLFHLSLRLLFFQLLDTAIHTLFVKGCDGAARRCLRRGVELIFAFVRLALLFHAATLRPCDSGSTLFRSQAWAMPPRRVSSWYIVIGGDLIRTSTALAGTCRR